VTICQKKKTICHAVLRPFRLPLWQ